MPIHLFTTTDVQSDRQEVLARMLTSVERAVRSGVAPPVHLHLLFQRCSPEAFERIKATLPAFVESSAVDRQVPLSTARNMLLAPLLTGGGIPDDALVAFPDDDGWYPDGLVERLTTMFAADSALGFFFCRYGSEPRVWAEAGTVPAAAGAKQVVRNASSNTIFVRGKVAKAVGLFDETLGLGTPNHGAEDLDYALRAYLVADVTLYADDKLVGHRDKTPGISVKYYRGGLITLARYATRSAGLGAEYVRKLGVGLYLCLRRQMGYGDYMGAIRSGRGGAKA